MNVFQGHKAAFRAFFDRLAVIKAVGDKSRKVLSKFGAYVRQSAKMSIAKRDGTSPPGHPPYSHKGLLREGIFFAYEPSRQSVVIGPVRFKGDYSVPEVLEHGGVVRNRRSGKIIRYEARPFMGPALEREKSKLPKIWADVSGSRQ